MQARNSVESRNADDPSFGRQKLAQHKVFCCLPPCIGRHQQQREQFSSSGHIGEKLDKVIRGATSREGPEGEGSKGETRSLV